MSAWLEIHTVLSLKVDAREAYRLMHNYRDEELAKALHAAADEIDDAQSRLVAKKTVVNILRRRANQGGEETAPADGQAYDGELAMLRDLVRTLRVVARPDDADMGEIRRLLHHHAADDAAAREQGKSSHQADATPESARETRPNQLLDAIRTHGGKWSTRQVQEIRRLSNGPTQRGTARRDLAELHRRGHLHQHGAGDGRYYTLLRKGGTAR